MTIWGSSAAFVNGNTGLEEWVRINNLIKGLNGGYGMQARRSYDTGIPTSINGTYAAQDVGHRVSVFSVRPVQTADTGWNYTINGNHDAAIRSFVNSVPSGHKMYLIYNHEPENDGGSPHILWRQAFARFAKVVLDCGKSNVTPAFNLMAYTWNSSRNPWDYNPARHMTAAEAGATVGLLDGYGDDNPSGRNPVANFAEAYTQITSEWGFRGFGVAECGVFNVPGRGDWMLDLEDFADARPKCELICWWHAADPGASYFLDAPINNDPTSFQVWADIIARNQGADIPVSDPGDVELPPSSGGSGGGGNSTGTPVTTNGQQGGAYRNLSAAGLSSARVLAGPDMGPAMVCGGRVYWAGPAGGGDGYNGSAIWNAAITYDNTVDATRDRIWYWSFDDNMSIPRSPRPGGRPVLSDHKVVEQPSLANAPYYFTYYDSTWDEYGDTVWLFWTGNGTPFFYHFVAVLAFSKSTGEKLAEDYYTYYYDGSASMDHMLFVQGVALSETEALVVSMTFDNPDWHQTWRKYTQSGSGFDVDLVDTHLDTSDSGDWIHRYDRDSGIGMTVTENQGPEKTAWTWTYTGSSVVVHDSFNYRAQLNQVFGANGVGGGWMPDLYDYGNSYRLSNGHHVDVAYWDDYDADTGAILDDAYPEWPWNIVYEYSWDEGGVTVHQWAHLPPEAHAPSAADNLSQHVIGWGMGDTNSKGIAFDDSSGVLQMFFDFGYVFSVTPTETNGDGEQGHHLVTDPFGSMLVATLTDIGINGFENWPALTDPDQPGYFIEMPWTGGWDMNEGWLVNWGNYFATDVNPTSTGEVLTFPNPSVDSPPGYPNFELGGSDAVVWRISGGEIPNLTGEFISSKRQFTRSQGDYGA